MSTHKENNIQKYGKEIPLQHFKRNAFTMKNELIKKYLQKKESGEFETFMDHGLLDKYDYAGYYLCKFGNNAHDRFIVECDELEENFFNEIIELIIYSNK